MDGAVTTEGFEEVAVIEMVWDSLAAPEEMPVSGTDCCGALTARVRVGSASSVGASFTETTGTRKVAVVELPVGSEAVMVTNADPNALGAGVKFTARLPLV